MVDSKEFSGRFRKAGSGKQNRQGVNGQQTQYKVEGEIQNRIQKAARLKTEIVVEINSQSDCENYKACPAGRCFVAGSRTSKSQSGEQYAATAASIVAGNQEYNRRSRHARKSDQTNSSQGS